MTDHEQFIEQTRERVQAGDLPEVDVYTCACGLGTVAVAGTEDVRCSCGAVPVKCATLRREDTEANAAAFAREVWMYATDPDQATNEVSVRLPEGAAGSDRDA